MIEICKGCVCNRKVHMMWIYAYKLYSSYEYVPLKRAKINHILTMNQVSNEIASIRPTVLHTHHASLSE